MTANDAPVRLRGEIAKFPPYRQGKAASDDGFKLSSNENPFPPLPAVVEALAKNTLTQINRYPDATASRLRAALANKYGIQADEVHIGTGSVSILSQLVQAAAGPGDEVIYAWRSFEAYPWLVLASGATAIEVPLLPNSRHDLDAIAAAVTDNTRAIILCTPNNPTSTIIGAQDFERFITKIPKNVLVILDEAYFEFVGDEEAVNGDNYLPGSGHDNVVVLRTFSKAYGLAGVRVGYALGHSRILDGARATAIPLSVTALAEDAALISLESETELLERVAIISDRREKLVAELRGLGLNIPESEGNFIWLGLNDETERFAQAFFDEGLSVRAFPGSGIRVSIGEEESVTKVIRILESLVGTLPVDHPIRAIA